MAPRRSARLATKRMMKAETTTSNKCNRLENTMKPAEQYRYNPKVKVKVKKESRSVKFEQSVRREDSLTMSPQRRSMKIRLKREEDVSRTLSEIPAINEYCTPEGSMWRYMVHEMNYKPAESPEPSTIGTQSSPVLYTSDTPPTMMLRRSGNDNKKRCAPLASRPVVKSQIIRLRVRHPHISKLRGLARSGQVGHQSPPRPPRRPFLEKLLRASTRPRSLVLHRVCSRQWIPRSI